MKRHETDRNTGTTSSSRRYRYCKVYDNRKHAVRGLWQRNGNYLARITVEDETGQHELKWVPLNAATDAEAILEFNRLVIERDENRLRHIGLAPLFKDYSKVYFERQKTSKRPDTLVTENSHLVKWDAAIGNLRLDKVRPHHLTAHLAALVEKGLSARTRNLSLVTLRNVFKSARLDGYVKTSPADGLDWLKCPKKAHRLYSADEIDRICEAAAGKLQNAVQFIDYIRFMQYSGAREAEATRVRWQDVDMEQGHVMIGAEGDAKNREARAVDLSPQLHQLLEDMATRRAPDSQWLLPSPRRGERDEHIETFRESLLLAREAARLPDFGFHDLRRFFASRAIMSGIDVLTVSRWLGHKDGGLLLLKSYAHLANEHRKTQAQRLNFKPAVVSAVSAA